VSLHNAFEMRHNYTGLGQRQQWLYWLPLRLDNRKVTRLNERKRIPQYCDSRIVKKNLYTKISAGPVA